MFDCPDILREFLFYLETIQGRSPKTVNGYYIELRTFLRYLKSVKVLKKLPQNAEELAQIKIDDVTKELVCSVTLSDIYDFLHFSLDVLGNSTASRSRKIAAIRALYKYLTTKTSYLEENPAKNLDTPAQRKSIPKYLTLEESLRLLDSVQDESPAVTARDYCMLTLMLNYVALYTIQALQQGPWRDPTQLGFFKVARFSSSARVPEVLGVHAGWIVALALVALFYVYLRHSKQGYELTVVGENEATARYAGMPVKRVVIRTMFLSAGVCGLAGMLQASGADRTLNDTVAGGVGFTAITVAWLAQLNPFAMVAISMLLAVLEKGASTLETQMAVPASISDIITGIFLFCMLGCEFFINYRLIVRGGHKEGAAQ